MSPDAESAPAFRDAIRRGDRRAIARTITLLESTRPDQAALGQEILDALVPDTGGAIRVGVTGPPGVGKSTFIEALGLHLLARDHRVAVLAVDPSSPVSGGSILGDKTRMDRLAQDDRAFIRPSPSGGSLGGVAQRTREAMLVCEAAGYDVVLVETVGIGQSEIAVHAMVDFFLVLVQPGAGDDLQGIKKGVLELADALVVTKADGEQRASAERARGEHARALEILRAPSPSWKPRVLVASASAGEGVPEVWAMIEEHQAAVAASGEREARRRDQARSWMWSLVDQGLRDAFRSHPEVARRAAALERDVEASRATPAAAARVLLEAFRKG
ncbi:MAG TPA: methylmalonyl Co-A mutase-associated GTPase MeaB [Myxococcota bacterium]|jgi:LAO/AO transport system kinase